MENPLTFVNCPVQGSGAVVMRESVFNCDAAGLDCIFTLHDALYIECDLGDWAAVEKLAIAMTEGFSKVCGDGKGLPARISRPVQVRLDGSAWGYGLAPEVRVLEVPGVVSPVPVKCTERYIDGRSKDDFEKFKKYLTVEGLF